MKHDAMHQPYLPATAVLICAMSFLPATSAQARIELASAPAPMGVVTGGHPIPWSARQPQIGGVPIGYGWCGPWGSGVTSFGAWQSTAMRWQNPSRLPLFFFPVRAQVLRHSHGGSFHRHH
jgi:hypothetical protein